MNQIKKIWKVIINNFPFILFFYLLAFVIFPVILISLISKEKQISLLESIKVLWNFLEIWQSVTIICLSFYLYLIFFIFYSIFYETIFNKKQWIKKNKLQKNKLFNSIPENMIWNDEKKKEEIIKKINWLFEHQDSKKDINNFIFIDGEYGSGKTCLTGSLLRDLEKKDSKIKDVLTFYIDVSNLEIENDLFFSKYLLNEIVKCISYKKYLLKLLKLRFIKIFSKKIPFDLISEKFDIKNSKRSKIIIVIDEIDRCSPKNIINTISVLKNCFLDIENVIILILENELILEPIIKDYLKITNTTNSNKNYLLFWEKIKNEKQIVTLSNSDPLSLENEFMNNNIIQNLATELNYFIFKNKISENRRKNKIKLTPKTFSSNSELYRRIRNGINIKKTNKMISDLFDFIEFLILLKSLTKINPTRIKTLDFNNVSINTKYSTNFENYYDFQNLINIEKFSSYFIQFNGLKYINLPQEYILKNNHRIAYFLNNIMGVVYAVTFDNKILIIDNDGRDTVIAKLKEIPKLLVFDKNNNIYFCSGNNSIYILLNSENYKKINKFIELEKNIKIDSLSIDIFYLYAAFDNQIIRINLENKDTNIFNFNFNTGGLYLANISVNNNLKFITHNDNQINHINNFSATSFWHTINGLSKQERKKVYIDTTNETWVLGLVTNKIFKNKQLLSLNETFLNDHQLTSVMWDQDSQSLVLSSLFNKFYDIKITENSYSFSLKQNFLDEILQVSYNEAFILREKEVLKMNYFDFYFIKNKNIPFHLIYSRLPAEYKNKEQEYIAKVFSEFKLMVDLTGKSEYLALILEYGIDKYKFIFDVSKDKTISFYNLEDIWWKLSQIKECNLILKNYDNYIHNSIINLTENEWNENHYIDLIDYLNKFN